MNTRFSILLLFSFVLFLFACGKGESEIDKTFSKLLGYSNPADPGFYSFFIDDQNTIITYNAVGPGDLEANEPRPMSMCLEKVNEFGDEIWKMTYDLAYESRVYGSVKTNDGGFLLAGLVSEGLYIPYSNSAICLIRTDETGALVWQKTFNDFDGSYASQVYEEDDGNIILMILEEGLNRKIWRLDPEGNVLEEITSLPLFSEIMTLVSTGDIVLAGIRRISLVDALGNLKWVQDFESTSNDSVRSFNTIIETDEGGFLAYGDVFYNGADENVTDFLLVKLNEVGDVEWELIIDEDKRDTGYDVSITPEGDYLCVGTVQPELFNINHLRVHSFDPEGNQQWIKKIEFDRENFIYPSYLEQLDENYLMLLAVTALNSGPNSNYKVRLIKTEK